MENLHVPVLTPAPVGRLEWAYASGVLYGVDSIGQVFRFEPVVVTPRGSALSRALASILGRPIGAAVPTPRYRRVAL